MKLPTQLPTHRSIFGAQFEILHQNICSVIKELGRKLCFTRRRSQVRVLSRPPSVFSVRYDVRSAIRPHIWQGAFHNPTTRKKHLAGIPVKLRMVGTIG